MANSTQWVTQAVRFCAIYVNLGQGLFLHSRGMFALVSTILASHKSGCIVLEGLIVVDWSTPSFIPSIVLIRWEKSRLVYLFAVTVAFLSLKQVDYKKQWEKVLFYCFFFFSADLRILHWTSAGDLFQFDKWRFVGFWLFGWVVSILCNAVNV